MNVFTQSNKKDFKKIFVFCKFIFILKYFFVFSYKS